MVIILVHLLNNPTCNFDKISPSRHVTICLNTSLFVYLFMYFVYSYFVYFWSQKHLEYRYCITVNVSAAYYLTLLYLSNILVFHLFHLVIVFWTFGRSLLYFKTQYFKIFNKTTKLIIKN